MMPPFAQPARTPPTVKKAVEVLLAEDQNAYIKGESQGNTADGLAVPLRLPNTHSSDRYCSSCLCSPFPLSPALYFLGACVAAFQGLSSAEMAKRVKELDEFQYQLQDQEGAQGTTRGTVEPLPPVVRACVRPRVRVTMRCT